MPIDELYPPTPSNVPPEITRIDSAYRSRVIAMIFGLFLFLLLYLVFIAIAGLIAYLLLLIPLEGLKGRGLTLVLILKFGGAFSAFLLCLFLVKGLFKGHSVERSNFVELKRNEYPVLFEFIERVYRDVGAPAPRRVYVNSDVNAALVYNTSIINLILPPKKDLLLGLGLVNVVNLSEFKAVLAHEFGHFAQRSVGLGSYLYVANRVMSDVIYSRDGLDRFVDSWSQVDIRISFPAWGLKGILWIVRKILAGTYQALNLLHLSLGRQMEFNADNVAVSVTGSDAIINGLSRLEFANACLSDAAVSLDAAADHDLFTDDVFYHQTQAASRLRVLNKDEKIGIPPALPENPSEKINVFQKVEDGIPDKYRTHPTEYMREQNAKKIYVRSHIDERSPWLLLGDAARLKRTVTENFYQYTLGRTEEINSKPAQEVQEFINAEHAERSFDPKYFGFYDSRLIDPGELKNLPENSWDREAVRNWFAKWPSENLEKRMEEFNHRRGEYSLLQGIQNGDYTLKDEKLTFRGKEYSSREIDTLFEKIDKELDTEIAELHVIDREVYLAHWSLARELDSQSQIDNSRESEILHRYRFHMKLQAMLQELMGQQSQLRSIFTALSANSEFSQEDFAEICRILRGIHNTLIDNLRDAKQIRTPSFTNVAADSELHSLVIDRGDTELPRLKNESLSGEWLSKLNDRLEGVLYRMKRIHSKSLGSLLAYQESLARQL